MDRLAHRVVAAEAERYVGDAARDLRIRQIGTNPEARFDEINRVVVVFLDAGGDGKDVRVEDDVFRRKANTNEQIVGTLANLSFACISVGLPCLVEGHDDNRCAIPLGEFGVMQKGGFALFHRD